MAVTEYHKLKDGRVIPYYTKSTKVRSYSEAMPFSRDEITMRYVIFPDNVIVIVDVFFPVDTAN
jgi:hypothetical protein